MLRSGIPYKLSALMCENVTWFKSLGNCGIIAMGSSR